MAKQVAAMGPVDGPWALPDGWEWRRLGDLGEFLNGAAFKPSDWGDEGTPIIRIQNLNNPDRPMNRTTRTVNERLMVREGDLLVSWSATLDAFLWRREDAWLNQHIFKVVPNEALVDRRYMFFLLKNEIENLKKTEHLHGSTMMHINRGPFLAHLVPVPPIQTQVGVAARIEELFAQVDDGEAALARVRNDLAMWRKALVNAAVTGELTADWRADNPSAETGCALLARILVERRGRWSSSPTGRGKSYAQPIPPSASDAPPLPAGWASCSADQVSFFITKGTTPPKSLFREGVAEIPFIRVTNLTSDGTLNFSDKVFVASDVHEGFLSRSITLPADVLMNIVGPPLGQVSVVPDDFPEWNINQAIARFRPVEGLLPEYLALMMRSKEVQAWFARRSKATSGQVNLTLELCRTVPLALPPVTEQREILRRLADVLTSASMDLSPMQQVAATLRQSILAAAFRGDLA